MQVVGIYAGGHQTFIRVSHHVSNPFLYQFYFPYK